MRAGKLLERIAMQGYGRSIQRNDIEPGACGGRDYLKIIGGKRSKLGAFFAINRAEGRSKPTSRTRLHFDENNGIALRAD